MAPGGNRKSLRETAEALFGTRSPAGAPVCGASAEREQRYNGSIVFQTASALDAFVRMAAARDEFIYAEAPEPPRSEECWSRAAELARLGLIRTHQRRRAGGGWTFIAVRTARALPRQRHPQEKVLSDRATAAIFAELKRAARLSLPCPSDSDLADKVGLDSRSKAQWRVRELVRVELVCSTLAYDCGVPSRVMTIADTRFAGAAAGKFTALPRKWKALMAAAAKDSAAAREVAERELLAADLADLDRLRRAGL